MAAAIRHRGQHFLMVSRFADSMLRRLSLSGAAPALHGRTFGLLGSALVDEPGAMPRLAFQRARLSSSASSLAYSSTLFSSPTLYPSVSVGGYGWVSTSMQEEGDEKEMDCERCIASKQGELSPSSRTHALA